MPRAHAVLRASGHAFWPHLFSGVSTRCRQIAAIVNENARVTPSVIHNGLRLAQQQHQREMPEMDAIGRPADVDHGPGRKEFRPPVLCGKADQHEG